MTPEKTQKPVERSLAKADLALFLSNDSGVSERYGRF